MSLIVLVAILCGLSAQCLGESLREEFERFKEKSERFEEEIRQELTAIKAARFPSAAFSLRLSGDTDLSDSALIYDVVGLNIGDGYDDLTGVFTPPVDGVYLLTAYAIPSSARLNGPMYLKRNDDIICSTYISGNYPADTDMCSVVAQLSVGDSVYVCGDFGDPARLAGNNLTGFVGHIVSDSITV